MREEYNFHRLDKVIIMSGSKTSQGFSITKNDLIKNCAIYRKLSTFKDLVNFKELPNGYIEDSEKIYTWSEIDSVGYFSISADILKHYYVKPKDNVLVGRGSGFALAFIKTGPIVFEALRHSELIVYY